MTRLFYVMDPMCSWCWAFSGPWRRLVASLGDDVELRHVMGGLAPDSDAPMPESMRLAIAGTWRAIEERTGAAFNHDFWRDNLPRRSTYPACRAVIAAGTLADDGRSRMIDAIQRAYYLEARNPSDVDVLVDVAEAAGFLREAFIEALDGERVRELFDADVDLTRRFGVQGFPTVIVARPGADGGPRYALVTAGYCDHEALAGRWRQALDALGPAAADDVR